MNIQNILVTGRIFKEIEKMMESNTLNKSFKFIAQERVTQEDLDWADAYVSFAPIKDLDDRNIKWVHSLGAGVDSFLLNREWNAGVLLTRTVCSFGEKISEYCLSYILRDIQLHDVFEKDQLEKVWAPKTPKLLKDQKVLVFGTGEIGLEIAKKFNLLGIQVFGVSMTGTQKEPFQQVYKTEEIHQVTFDANYVINTLPLTDQTYHLFNQSLFQRFNQVTFINCGRGGSVDDGALIEALNQGHVRQAVLDVFSVEPLPEDHAFWCRKDIKITPHISAITSPEDAVACFLETMENIENNSPLSNKVDTSKGY
ncbi:D-2-hydroxyacid dehydrogenase [Cytobacillus sp. FJAT-54145]|uniref:D-2-hydroxyacid dehydrogenase n=1 Tax=Cytobacillus spartinae TaxID=3299023 RepID=A0ABW6KA75_9BACI